MPQPTGRMDRRSEPLRIFSEAPLPAVTLTRVKKQQTFSFYGSVNHDGLVAAAADFLESCTDAAAVTLQKPLSEFLRASFENYRQEAPTSERLPLACWLTIRVWEPTDAFAVPRWHRDGRMFTCSCPATGRSSGVQHCKYAVTLLGPATLLIAPGQEHVDQVFRSCEWWREKHRAMLAEKLMKAETVPLRANEIVRFSWGEEDSPIHSEPDCAASDRVFMSILYGSEEELQSMCQLRGEKYGEI